MIRSNGSRQQAMTILEQLPEEEVEEVMTFLDFLQFRNKFDPISITPYEPVAMEGLWQGAPVRDEDIVEIRREMWHGFGERDM